MANIRKSFNFRTGLQVDNDNFIVNANGLVGIGTSIPQNYLFNVHGDTRVTGLVTTSNLYATTGTVDALTATNANFTGILTAAQIQVGSSNTITSLVGYAYTAWITNDGGVGLHTISRIGIGTTTTPSEQLKVFGDVAITEDVTLTSGNLSITSGNLTLSNGSVGLTSGSLTLTDGNLVITTGNINASSGIVTASSFVGSLNASNLSSGTVNNSRLPSNINVSGIVTATTFVGALTGTATTASSLSGSPNITVTDITSSDITASDISASNITASNASATGIVTATTELNVGTGGTALTVLNSGKLGIGSITPTKEIQVLKTGDAYLEITGTDTSQIIIGQQQSPSIGVGNSTAIIRFGNEQKTLDVINADSGDFNSYLHLSPGTPGITTGSFNWIYGQTLNKLMSLTYEGNLGVGITNPTNRLHVVGTSTVTQDSYVGGDLYVDGDIIGNFAVSGIITANINALSGVSTVYDLVVQNVAQIGSIGIGTTNPIQNIDARTSTALFSSLGLGTESPRSTLDVNGPILSGGVGIGTTTTGGDGLVVSGESVLMYDNAVLTYGTALTLDGNSTVGFGTTSARSAIDFSDAGKDLLSGEYRFMLPPRITEAEKVGLSTVAGAFIFNTTTSKFQGYTGVAWTDFH